MVSEAEKVSHHCPDPNSDSARMTDFFPLLPFPFTEQYKAEDEEAAARITAKNGLESYSYNLRNSVDGDLKDKLEASDKESLDKAITETISWLDASAEASKEEYEEKQKELEAVANPSEFFSQLL